MSVVESFIEIRFKKPDDFQIIRETLTRIGVASRREKKLYQSCHILHKKQRYYIVHFKELFKLDGKEANFTEDDMARRNTIVNILAEWKLLEIIDPTKSQAPVVPLSQVKIITHAEKKDWILEPKYNIGAVRKSDKTLQ